MIKRYFLVLAILICGVFCFNLPASADAMDPLNNYDTKTTTTNRGGTMSAPSPNGSSSSSSDDSTDEDEDTDLTLDEYQSQRRTTKLSQFMDSCMWIIGGVALLLPMIYLGIFFMAKVHPSFFGLVFYFITFKRVNADDIPVKVMVVRTLPISVLGFFLMNGTIKQVLRIVWFYVLRLVT